MSEAEALTMPTFLSIQGNIQFNRQDHHKWPNPLVRDVMPELPNEYRQTASGAQFFVFSGGLGDPNRMIIFDLQNAINLLRNFYH